MAAAEEIAGPICDCREMAVESVEVPAAAVQESYHNLQDTTSPLSAQYTPTASVPRRPHSAPA